MKKLLRGLKEFQETYFAEHQDLFEQLAHGQKPRVLFITCSDSRIIPSLITQTDPGDLFVIRNAGNIVPPFGSANGGEGASIEYAVHALNIDQIIVCGHSHCGAMKGLLKLKELRDSMPLVCEWLEHAAATLRVMQDCYGHLEGEDLIEATVAENVITQIENLKTYPVIHSRLHQKNLEIYGWIYEIESGEVLAYDPDTHEFKPPQTELSQSGQPQNYVKTSAPPLTVTVSSGPNGAEAHRPVVSSWVSEAQADRIYRGSMVGSR